MARIVILGAVVAGHTAARHLGRLLPRDHEVIVVSPNSKWNWIPSIIWQFYRFIVFNYKMLKLMAKSHHKVPTQ